MSNDPALRRARAGRVLAGTARVYTARFLTLVIWCKRPVAPV